MKRIIEVIPYNANWASQFRSVADKLNDVFNRAILDIHHIGSTSVPGLAAKPTIDILVVVAVGTVIEDYYARMVELGYQCRGECLDAVIPGTPGRHYFPKVVEGQHVVHVHVCHKGHKEIAGYLALRNYLRNHPQEANKYGVCKASLAERFRNDNIGYMRGKDEMVKSILSKAIAWCT